MAYNLEIYYDTGDDEASVTYTTTWRGQTFTTVGGFDLSRVSMKLYRTGSPGDITLGVYATSSGLPTGSALATKTIDSSGIPAGAGGTWIDFDLDSALTLSASTMYAIVLSAPSGNSSNYISMRRDGSSPTYTGGTAIYSTTSGGSWSIVSTADFMFRTYSGGEEPPPSGGIPVKMHYYNMMRRRR